MTIRRGEPWGEPVARPAALVVARSDAELAELVAEDRSRAFGVLAGDIHRSVGSPSDRQQMQRLPFDAFRVSLDGRTPVIAVAHVIACRRWWRGPIVAVMNCDHLGEWNVAPRAHPNDGRADVVEVAAEMPWRGRIEARRRLPQGTHVPHPQIAVRTTGTAEWSFSRPLPVTIDGIVHAACSRLTVAVLPDHFAIHV